MPEIENCDNLVIGSGEAGKYLAWSLAKAGQRTVVVERKLIGGSCPNIACLPSKNVIYSAKVASLTRRGLEFGLETGPIATNMEGVQRRKRLMVEGLIQMHLDHYKASGAELIMGEARFIAPRTVDVSLNNDGAKRIAGDRVFLNLGTRAAMPDWPGLAAAQPLTHVEALDLDRLPNHLIVLGGGFVSLELAQAMRRFGARVTVIERGPQLASHEDPDVGGALLELFQDEGIEVLLETQVNRVEGRSGQQVQVHTQSPKGGAIIEGTDLLVAMGRTPSTRGMGLDKA
jgi:pyruvate/2-oxoglutarate dehydrogenase complex dihydrolipoamide dehydrogenase (E3) component